MTESAYAQPYRDEFPETCWRKLDEPGRVCIIERGHDDGAHEPAADVSEQGHKGLMEALARGELLPRDASVPLYEVVWQMKEAGMTEAEIAEVLARTPAEDEYVVIREVLDRRSA